MDAQETKVFVIILLLTVALGVIIYSFFASLRNQHQRILELKMQNITVELNSIERERSRTAADLHDELAPLLAAIKLKISSFDLTDDEDRWQQDQTDHHLEEVLRRLRTIAYNMMPVTLLRKGIGAALHEFARFVSNRNGLQIKVIAGEVALSQEQNIHLYRIAQEIVHNTVKHANATSLQLELKQDKDIVVFLSRDNGKGFDYRKSLREGSGSGLRNLHTRTDVLGGELFADSQAGIGTMYVIEIPVRAV